MTEQQIAAAWNEQPFPLDLPENEQAAYIALTMIYRHYRENVLTRKQAQLFKEQLTDWAHCPPMERATAAVCARQRMGARQERRGCVGESAYSVHRVWDANASEVYGWVKGCTAKMRQTKN